MPTRPRKVPAYRLHKPTGQSVVRHDPRSRAHYDRLRARGHSHGRALRGVVDRLLRVLIAMLTTQTLYDSNRRLPIAA